MNEGVVEKIRAAGGEVYAITSEPQNLADQAHEHWELNFENVGDPHQEVSQTCSERGWLTVYANRGDLEFLRRGAKWEVEHPKGYFQPGVLALTGQGRVLYRWRSVPSDENLGGTVARPTASHVWDHIEASLNAGDGVGDAAHDDNPVIDQAPPPRLVFYAALIANGWFLQVKSFAYSPGVGSIASRFRTAFLRWILFFLFWFGASFSLPAPLVATAFAGWLIWIVRDLKKTLGALESPVELIADS
jgi:hypothetical protein